MGSRFRKSVKICKGVKVNFSKSGMSLSLGGRGHSVNVGGRGVRTTVGIPGTGLSYSTKLGGGSKPKKKTSSANSSKSSIQIPKQIALSMNDKGQVIISDAAGNVITDEAVIRKIKTLDSYKKNKEILDLQRREKIDEIVHNAEDENAKFINIHEMTPIVESREYFEKQIEKIEIEKYEVERPTKQLVEDELAKEASEVVEGPFWKVGKLRRQYIDERIEQRLAEMIEEWSKDKEEAEELYARNYEESKEFFINLIEGNTDIICEMFDEWISLCELPVEIDINYEYDKNASAMLLDVDLPEIEDLPETIMTKTDSGNLKEKKKPQGQIREEYATCVWGLAVFISANVFNISPAIKNILISGYTQRRDKNGNLNDDYIYSIKFTRDTFEGINVAETKPQDVCMSVTNRCNTTSTMLFKTITPYDSLDDNEM